MRYRVENAQIGRTYLRTDCYRTACLLAFRLLDLDTAQRAGISTYELTDEIRDRFEECYIGVVDTENGNHFTSMVI